MPTPPDVVPITRTADPVFDVAPGVTGLRSVMVNVYFVALADSGGVGRWVLIDAGLPFSAAAIRAEAARRFGGQPPEAILLTHGHFDHVGVVRALAEEWDVPVYAHPLELPYLSGRASYAPPDPWVGGSMALASVVYPRGPIDLGGRLRPLPSGGAVPFLGDWRWIHTPGHSPGHVSFFREADGTLVAGDAFVTCRQEYATTVIAQTQAVSGPPRYFTHDWAAAADSVRLLAALPLRSAGTGHGTPMGGERLREQLAALAADFERTQVPNGGRYADEPVVSDEQGPERVPPAKPVPRAAIALGVALAAGGLVGVAAAVAAAKRSREA